MPVQIVKPLLFVLCLVPAALLGWQLYADELGANPIEALTRGTGEWTLRFLLITLLMTPLKRITGWYWPARVRRMLGLYAFFYACVHLMTYVWLDQFFDWYEIWMDILDRPFITVGMAAFVLLVPLAVTSNRYAIKRMGRNWKRLHRLVYAIAVMGVLHFWWLVKADIREPAIYAVLLAALLAVRVPELRRRVAGKTTQQPAG